MAGRKDTIKIVGSRIKTERNIKGWTQAELAEEVKEYATVSNITRMEKQETTTRKTLQALSDAFGVLPEYLEGKTEYRTREEKEKAIFNEDLKENESVRDFLRKLGIDTEIAVYLRITASELINNAKKDSYTYIKDHYLSESESKKLNELLEMPFVDDVFTGIYYFEISRSDEFCKIWLGERKPGEDDHGMIRGSHIEPRYKIIKNDNVIGSISPRNMHCLCNAIKSCTQGIVNSFMSKGYSSDFLIVGADPMEIYQKE